MFISLPSSPSNFLELRLLCRKHSRILSASGFGRVRRIKYLIRLSHSVISSTKNFKHKFLEPLLNATFCDATFVTIRIHDRVNQTLRTDYSFTISVSTHVLLVAMLLNDATGQL